MSWLRRVRNTFRRPAALDERIDEEMALHLEMRAAELEARGLSAEAARREARRAFGSPSAHADAARDTREVEWLARWLRDLRYAVRNLTRRPGLVATALLSLGLGVGANVAIFTVLDAVALRPLPIPTLDRLYLVSESKAGEPTGGNPLRLRDWREQVTGFAAATGYYGEDLMLAGFGDPVRIPVLRLFGDYLTTFGERPVAGRGFTEVESAGEPVALLRASVAARRFGSPAAAVGRLLTLDGAGYTVVGVLGDRAYPADVDAWLPAGRELQQGPRVASYLEIAALVRTGRTAGDAERELGLVQARLARTYPATDAERTASLVPYSEAKVGAVRSGILIIQGIAAAVLMIACLNLAGLLLARAGERQRESAIRAALGAGRGSLVRLYLAESALIGGAGGVLGLVVAAVAVRFIRLGSWPVALPRVTEAVLDGRAVAAAVAFTVAAVLSFGTAPALAAARGSLLPSLGRTAPRQRVRSAVVAVQAALAVVLLLAAGVLGASVRRLAADGPVFADRALAVRVNFPWTAPGARVHGFSARALASFAAIPGVRSVGLADRLPLEGGTQSGPVSVPGRALPPEFDTKSVSIRAVSAGYFAAMGLPFVAGATLGDRRTAVVNQEFAAEWLGDAPVGRRIVLQGRDTVSVVGVVPGARQAVAVGAVQPEVFIDARETFWPQLVFVLRTTALPTAVVSAVRDRVREIDPGLPIDAIAPLDAALAEATRPVRLLTGLVVAFAAVAVGLVGVGLFGILAGYVAQRRGEIGVRLALGARPATVGRQVAFHGLGLVGAGTAAGLIGWAWFGDLTRLLPVEVRPQAVGPILAGVGVFAVFAALACLIPAWRAARIDPATVLRTD